MILPRAPAVYDPTDQDNMREALRRADRAAHKKNQDIEVGAGRLIITAPDGSRWVLTVNAAGTLSTTAV